MGSVLIEGWQTFFVKNFKLTLCDREEIYFLGDEPFSHLKEKNVPTTSLSTDNIIYILSISFQIAGALLLLVYSTSAKRESIIRRFVGKGLLTRQGDKVEYNQDAYEKEYFLTYSNKLSFGYIAFGYLVNVFGNIENACKGIVFISILLCTVLIMVVSIKGLSFFVKHFKEKDKITNDDLKTFDIKPDMDLMTSENVDQLFENAWNATSNDKN